MTEVSNTHTAGHTLKQNHRITGDSRRQTHSLLRSEKTFGINSPSKMVRNVNGITMTMMARTSAAIADSPKSILEERLDAFAGADAADGRGAGAQQRHRHLRGREAGLHVLLHEQGGLGPARFSRARTWRRAIVTAASAIS